MMCRNSSIQKHKYTGRLGKVAAFAACKATPLKQCQAVYDLGCHGAPEQQPQPRAQSDRLAWHVDLQLLFIAVPGGSRAAERLAGHRVLQLGMT